MPLPVPLPSALHVPSMQSPLAHWLPSVQAEPGGFVPSEPLPLVAPLPVTPDDPPVLVAPADPPVVLEEPPVLVLPEPELPLEPPVACDSPQAPSWQTPLVHSLFSVQPLPAGFPDDSAPQA